MRSVVEKVIQECAADCYWNTSMALDIICEKLFYTHGLNAKWQGRSIYIGSERVASIEVSREGKNIIAIWRYKILGGKK